MYDLALNDAHNKTPDLSIRVSLAHICPDQDASKDYRRSLSRAEHLVKLFMKPNLKVFKMSDLALNDAHNRTLLIYKFDSLSDLL